FNVNRDTTPQERIRYVRVAPAAAPAQPVGNGSDTRVKPKKEKVNPAPLLAPSMIPTAIPPLPPPSVSPGAGSGTPGGQGNRPAGRPGHLPRRFRHRTRAVPRRSAHRAAPRRASPAAVDGGKERQRRESDLPGVPSG